MSGVELERWSAARRAALDRYLERSFTAVWPSSFAEACRYPLFGGGKRIRPLLVFAAFEALTSRPVDDALPAAAAVEMVHTYSLVHDDLPCMDDDDERRGRPTVHRAFGEAMAVLAGDALLTEAFRVLATAPLPADVRVALIEELGTAAGHRGMVGGQAADIGLGASITDVDTLERLHRLKTGALIRASVRMGARVAGASSDQLQRLTTYGERLGLAFQLADDVLDADEAAAEDGPPSYVRLLGLRATQDRALRLAREAQDLVRPLGSTHLEALAVRLAVRDA